VLFFYVWMIIKMFISNMHKLCLTYCVIMVQSMHQIQEHKLKKVNFIL
jgi:hypothetical protein